MPPAPELILWATLPSTLIAVWLPLISSLVILSIRIRQGWSIRWWLGCVAVGIPLGLPLNVWWSGVGLYLISGFIPVWMIWFPAFAGAPQNRRQWVAASLDERERFSQTTDPGLVAAGVFVTLLIVDVLHALGRGVLTGIGGAGFGDALFLQPVFAAGMLAVLQVLVAGRRANC